jgi:hypothetical protein
MKEQVEEITPEEIFKLNFPEISESPEIQGSNAASLLNSHKKINPFYSDVNTSIGTLLSSSYSSNNLQTLTVTSMDSVDMKLSQSNVFSGDLDIEAIINQCIEDEEADRE